MFERILDRIVNSPMWRNVGGVILRQELYADRSRFPTMSSIFDTFVDH